MTPTVPQRDLRYLGVALMAIVAAFAIAGVGVGALLGSAKVGGFLGALVGVPVATVIVWRTFVRPFRDEFNARDYSHLSPKLGDDD